MYSSPLSEESSRVEWKEWRRKGRKRNERKREGVEEEGKGIVRREEEIRGSGRREEMITGGEGQTTKKRKRMGTRDKSCSCTANESLPCTVKEIDFKNEFILICRNFASSLTE